MRRIVVVTGAAALASMVLLAGCSQSHLAGKANSGSGGGAVADSAQSKAGGAYNGAAGAPAALPNGTAPQAKAPAKAKVPVTSAALIRTADLVVEITNGADVAAKANRAAQIATAAGGQVFADDRTAGTNPTAALTLKVPGESLTRVLGDLAALGKEKSRHSTTQDVTTQVADVTSRVRSAQASIDRLRALFSRATKVGDVISLESELSQREADLESLQAQQRSLAAQTEMATVTLNLSTASAATVAKKHQDKSGFLGGLQRGWRAFTHGAGAVATGFGAALPFLGLGLLILGVAVIVRRRLRNSTPPVITPPNPA
ncbi:MAG: DUF4349 domain-containing protein [Pseudonocardiales bacterium]|nr:MAG: DUF4349 domain-containing protein [Pseudonocardiales bacterium]